MKNVIKVSGIVYSGSTFTIDRKLLTVKIRSIRVIRVPLFQIQFNLQLIKLLLINRRWCIQHYITTGVILRKSNKVTDAFAAAKNRTKTVKPKGDAAMRRSAILKCAK